MQTPRRRLGEKQYPPRRVDENRRVAAIEEVDSATFPGCDIGVNPS